MSAKSQNLTQLAESLVNYGRKQGATEIQVRIGESRDFEARVFNGSVEQLTESGSRGLNLRVFVDGRKANASSSDLSEETLHRLMDNAIARARMGGMDAFAGLPDAGRIEASEAALQMHDPAILAMAPEKKIAFARELERIGLADKRVKKSAGSGFSTGEDTLVLVNSKGFSGSYRKTTVNCGVSFGAGEGDNLQEEGWYESSTRLDRLPSPEAIAKIAVDRTVRMIGARKVETQNVPMVTDPQMSARLMGFLAQCIGGASVSRRQTFLAEKLGQRIGNDLVTLVDDPLMPGGIASRPFDAEGVPSRRTAFVEKGVLKSFILDTYYGRRLKMASTGHAGGLTNFHWLPGTSTPEAIIKSIDSGLLLTGVMGQGTVPTTGDISLGASGLWIEKGAIAYPVAEITISGNLADLLMNVEMVGNDLHPRRGMSAPTLKFKQISVGGKAKA